MSFRLLVLFIPLFIASLVSYPVHSAEAEFDDEDLALIKHLAQSGDAQAQFSYALILDEGRSVAMDKPAAIYWFQKAAEQGMPAACLYLGMKYEFGNTVEPDILQAVRWYRKAAIQGWPAAQFHLGLVLQDGGNKDVDYVQSLAWLRLAEEGGYPGAGEEKEKVMIHLSAREVAQTDELLDKLRQEIKSISE